ncbi:ABC transporter ATP-binding protein [uncultured Levyella sp.]|uniref:ABC transporter ATP-binding protein n=1 Tax=uncultured Levyella sp. TaxID=1715800 RepID=UPI00258E781D|nr:ABC transporter ATP-binding protein [uncultured Levyella sp.]
MGNKDLLFKVQHMDFAYPEAPLLFKDFSLALPKGEVIAIVGQNGCGKSSLLNLLAKNLHPSNGTIVLENRSLNTFNKREFAKQVGMVHQQNHAPSDLLVEELVSYGRTPHKSLFTSRLSVKDWEVIDRVLQWTGVEDLRKRTIGTLSYGQLQRVWIAMSLAQETKILFLDEPTNFLDIRFQIEILKLVRWLNREQDMSIIMVLHDINQATAFSDRIVALKAGELLFNDAVQEFLQPSILREVYDIDLEIVHTGQVDLVKTV